MRDRAFFFTAVESYRLNRALELNVNVPTPLMRDLLMASMPFPETKLLLDQYQLPTEPVSTDRAPRRVHRRRPEGEQRRPRRRQGRLPGQGRKPVDHVHLRASVPGTGESAARSAARCGTASPAARVRATRSRDGTVELGDSIRLQLQLALANRPVLHGAGPGQPWPAGAGSEEPAPAAVDRLPWTDHSRGRAAYARPAAQLFVRAAGLDGGRESQRQARRHLRHAEGRPLQRHRSGVLVCLGGGPYPQSSKLRVVQAETGQGPVDDLRPGGCSFRTTGASARSWSSTSACATTISAATSSKRPIPRTLPASSTSTASRIRASPSARRGPRTRSSRTTRPGTSVPVPASPSTPTRKGARSSAAAGE